MNPWTLIGWVIVVIFAGISIYWTLKFIYAFCIAYQMTVKWFKLHEQTKNIAPQEGQIWQMPGIKEEKLYVNNVFPTHLSLSDSDPTRAYHKITWGHSFEEWSERVKNQKLFLAGWYK